MPILRLSAIKCIEQEDYWGDDDAFLTVNGITVWGPEKMDDEQTRVINKDVFFYHRAEIRLYEKDDAEPDDFLGSYTVTSADAGTPEKEISFTEDDANYKLWCVVLPDNRMKNSEILKQYS